MKRPGYLSTNTAGYVFILSFADSEGELLRLLGWHQHSVHAFIRAVGDPLAAPMADASDAVYVGVAADYFSMLAKTAFITTAETLEPCGSCAMVNAEGYGYLSFLDEGPVVCARLLSAIARQHQCTVDVPEPLEGFQLVLRFLARNAGVQLH